MAGIEIQPYKRLTEDTEPIRVKRLLHSFDFNTLFLFGLTLLLGRAVIGNGISPFATAFFAAAFSKNFMLPMLLGGAGGAITIGLGLESLKYLLAMLLYGAYKIMFRKSDGSKFLDCLVSGATLFLGGMIYLSFHMLLLYDVMILGLESVACAFVTGIFLEATVIIKRNHAKRITSNEQLISVGILLGLAVMGLDSVTRLGSVSLCGVICITAVLLICHTKGAALGACIGVAAGFICGANTGLALQTLGIYAVCALAAGGMRSMGRLGTATGFAVTALIMSIYANGATESIISVWDTALAIGAFLAIPSKTVGLIGKFIGGSDALYEPKAYSEKFRELVSTRLKDAGRIFAGISDTFSKLSDSRIKAYQRDMGLLFDDTSERVCKSCSMSAGCWQKDFHGTYQTMFDIVEKMEQKGYADVLDVPEHFRKRCVRLDDFMVTFNHLYELYKLNEVWVCETAKAQKAVSEQYTGMAGIMEAIATEVDTNIDFNTKLEKKIASELAKLHIKPVGIAVPEMETGRIEVELALKNKRDYECEGDILLAIAHVLDQPMKKTYANDDELVLRFEPIYTYSVTSGVSRLKKEGESQCGDSYCAVNLSGSRYLLAISDGMGSGDMAAVESGVAISLLEQLMCAGFDRETTINLINSALVMKSGYESFATIDLSFINLANGIAEFVKIGGVQSYVKSTQGVSVIYSSSLPAGILTDVQAQVSAKKLDDGDMIIMMTDGVADSCADSGWVTEFLSKVDEDDPKKLADLILKEAVINSQGVIKDDMTVVAAKIWEVQ